MKRMRRPVLVAASLVVALTLSTPGALAADVDEVLQAARDATFNASRLTISVWGGRTQVSDQWVEHWSGGEVVRTNSSWSAYGNGRAMTMGDSGKGFAFMSNRPVAVSERYSIGNVSDVTHLRRECLRVEINEGDIRRAVLIVDKLTGAILRSDTYTDTGKIFRTTSLEDFKPYRVYAQPSDSGSIPLEVVMHADSYGLPEEIAGYTLVDVFPGPGSSEQGFYSDGLFSFSLFTMSKQTKITGLDNPMAFVTNLGVYDMVPTAQDVRLHWSDTESNFVLVGDLPPDHARNVLAELPLPDAGSMFTRWWRRLFG
ncbi:MAG: hypothetical protein BMS9Abin17_0731 [Acidimicrobiia bacterium]|nr:MAG: hypothetical protein BMS9Abin17_0731 [Acidimicrobiia bacterium]